MKYFSGLILFLISCSSFAQNVFSYRDTSGLVSVEAYTSYLTDSSGKLTFEQIRAGSDTGFVHNTRSFLNFGNTEYPVWVRIDLKNNSDKDLYLIQELHDVRMLDVYVINELGVRSWAAGSMRPFGASFLKRNITVFDLGKFPEKVFLKIQNPNVYIPLKIGNLRAVDSYLHRYDLLYGGLYGLMIALIIYNLFVYVVVRDKLFLYYFFYILSSAYVIFRADNHHHEFIFGQIPYYGFDINLSSTITIFFTLVFANAYLKIKELAPVFYRILVVMMSVGILLLPSEWLPYRPWINDIYQLLYILLVLVLLSASIYIHFLGYKPARFFILAFGVYIFGVVSILLGFMGVLPMDKLRSAYIYQICSALEALLFALAVAYRFNTYRKEAKDARELALRRSQEHEELLYKNNLLLSEKLKIEETFRNYHPEKDLGRVMEQVQHSNLMIRKISIPTVEGIIMFPEQDINRLEAMGSYCTIHLSDHKKIMTSKPMVHFEQMIDNTQFMRIHKSHIVNLNNIVRYIRGEGGWVEMKDKSEIPVSRRLKSELLQRLTREQHAV